MKTQRNRPACFYERFDEEWQPYTNMTDGKCPLKKNTQPKCELNFT